ncbi:glycosyltransferase [Paenibacillus aurantius]|uniref:Glycosyltransferase n=1 Tax=Paenibacillus aurantius TaxID=2918900 RepID=A0AA96RIY8_9BACL|nr:glycosyltransferase [Paenibacillus aurantius]WNQ12689.1 glycosyltransferase [Paenibacillus aurantius]
MKQKLLFVMNNLNCGGAEKALVSLFETLDYTRFEVDLLLFKQEGMFMAQLPRQVRLLPEPKEFRYYDMPIQQAVLGSLKSGRPDITLSRLRAGYVFKSEKNSVRCEQRVWKYIAKSLPQLEKTYDIAVGYLEKNPIYFCIDKVKAKKTIGFIHNDYNKLGMDPDLDRKYFHRLDYLVTVSEECGHILRERFPEFRHKVEVMHNIISPAAIHKLSGTSIQWRGQEVHLLSVGRLNPQKGFELAIEACRELVQGGYPVQWSVIGEGEDRAKLQRKIDKYGLQNHFHLLGLKENPYPYIKEADIYVQPSRFEGKSIAIDEAKILQKPIVVTNFPTAKDQITHGVNGWVAEMNPKALSQAIRTLLDDERLRRRLQQSLADETLGTESEINKLYAMFN